MLNNIGKPKGIKNKLLFQSHCKFSIACENSKHLGYTTEKIVDAFAACTIPIYWGDPAINRVFNKKAFINIDDFNTWDDLIAYIRYIDENEDVYLEFLRQPAIINEKYLCEHMLCQFDTFLLNIFNQKDAFRRNMVFWGDRYQEQRLAESTFYEPKSNINIIDKIKTFLKL